MQKLILTVAFAATALVPAFALAEPNVKAAFGNTIVSTYPDARTGNLWLKEDGTYTATGRRKTSSSGKWSMKGQEICLKQKKPFAAPFTYCTKAPDGGIGTTWKAKAVTGEAITVKLVKGIVK